MPENQQLQPLVKSNHNKKNIQILHWLTDSVLFEFEKENNTLKDTLVEAIKNRIDLSYADLSGADLSGADLSGADLSGADLFKANLSDANLSRANLQFANLQFANLHCADLSGATIDGANLHCANLRRANLGNVNISGAVLFGADLREAMSVPYIRLACPSDGAFIGWKKVHGRLVKLEIPKDARRSSATTNKCRCDKALVLAITDLNGENPIAEIENTAQEHHLTYKVGEMVYPDSFDEDRWRECSHGIHFFIDKQDAIDYYSP